jgi:nucleoside 2-deoxyribosyltransferase
MNRLKNTRCYLAGAIEKVMDQDGGVAWREKLKLDLSCLGIQWLDPTDKPVDIAKETPESHRELQRRRSAGDIVGVQAMMYPICRIDLRMVDVADFLIVNIDPDVPTFGTHEEIGRAVLQNKPILVHLDGENAELPLWWYERIDPRLCFQNWGAMYNYLTWLNTAEVSDRQIMLHSDYRWIFFDWMGDK